MLSARRALPDAERRLAETRLRSALAALVAAVRPRVLAGYAPLPDEPGGADLPEVLARQLPGENRVLLPVLLPDLDLDWAPYATPGHLATRATGPALREPVGPALGPAGIGTADLIIVPALAVDHDGVRLGRGGGSYDRALARVAPAALLVALLFDGELRAGPLPAQPHDRRVHAVVTPSRGLVRLPARPPSEWTDPRPMAQY